MTCVHDKASPDQKDVLLYECPIKTGFTVYNKHLRLCTFKILEWGFNMGI